MKKIYSYVLMAAMLLIGTNAWAKDLSGNLGSDLQNAVNDIMNGTESDPVIKLTQDVSLDDFTSPSIAVWIGTAELDGTYKSVTIDLNGKKITRTGQRNAKNKLQAYNMFVLSHGELNIINSSATESTINLKGESSDGSQIFSVYGSYRSSRWNDEGTALADGAINTRDNGYFSHLSIGKGVKLVADDGCQGTAISCDAIAASKKFDGATTINYGAQIGLGGQSSYGYAFGVRIDVDCEIIMNGSTDSGSKAYGIKVNGMVQSPISADLTGLKTTTAPYKDYSYITHYAENNADIDENIANQPTHKLDTIDVPYIWVHPSAKIETRKDGKKSAAIYASGYAKWLIEGDCEGKTGVYISSGVVYLNDAYITSNSTTYEKPTSGGSANGGGSGVVVNSRGGGYSGDMEITVAGDTKVTGSTGYAIEEIVNTPPVVNPDYDPEDPESSETVQETKVENITITGGAIEGGDQGAIIISQETALAAEDENQSTEVTIYGGSVEGETTVGTSGDLNDLIPSTEDYHTTEVTVGDKTIVVVTTGAAPEVANSVVGSAANASVNWQNTETKEEILNSDLTLAELEINQDYNQTLIIASGKKLTVGRVVLGGKAQIVVNPGAQLLIKGEQGIVAPSVDNIILKTSAENPAIFLFNPAVSSNRHPNATVEFLSKSYRKSASDLAWQRFGIPTDGAVTEILAKYKITDDNIIDVATAFAKFNYASSAWDNIGFINQDGQPELNVEELGSSFEYYQMLHNTPNMGTIVTMKGRLVGNDNPVLNVREKFWNGFANSYMGPINGAQLMEMIPNTVDKAIYLYDVTANQATWESVTLIDMEDIEILPMQPFLIRNTKAAANVTINYGNAVYYPTTGESPSPAPARSSVFNDMTKVKLVVKGEDCIDRVIVAEGDQFSDDFDNGYDAAKYMNEGINMYVTSSEKMSIFATDHLENTYVGLQTIKGGAYSIEFSKVQGEDLTLIDLETGANVAMTEGNVYTFTAVANTTNDYRFQIVGAKKVATDVESVEAQKNTNGIYTIMGQYVGEMNLWNSLPAGVYVVNGKKLVK